MLTKIGNSRMLLLISLAAQRIGTTLAREMKAPLHCQPLHCHLPFPPPTARAVGVSVVEVRMSIYLYWERKRDQWEDKFLGSNWIKEKRNVLFHS